MRQFVQSVALLAALVAVAAGLWQEWGLLTTLKKALIAYLGVFILGALMVLTIRLVPYLEKDDVARETAPEGAQASDNG